MRKFRTYKKGEKWRGKRRNYSNETEQQKLQVSNILQILLDANILAKIPYFLRHFYIFGFLLHFLEVRMHYKENAIYVFPEKELRGLSPNFHIHVSVADLYIPRIGPLIFRQQNSRTIV